MSEITMPPAAQCWCGHQVKFHVMQICRWCARMERRYPYLDYAPRHKVRPTVSAPLLKKAFLALDAYIVKPRHEEIL